MGSMVTKDQKVWLQGTNTSCSEDTTAQLLSQTHKDERQQRNAQTPILIPTPIEW